MQLLKHISSLSALKFMNVNAVAEQNADEIVPTIIIKDIINTFHPKYVHVYINTCKSIT